MATQTPVLNLVKPDYAETADVAVINDNMDTLDTAVGRGVVNITRSGTTFTATRKDGTTFTFTQQDNNTTYSQITRGSGAGLAPGLPSGSGTTRYLREDGTWSAPPNTTYSTIGRGSSPGLAPGLPSGSATTKYLREDGTWQVPPNTTYSQIGRGSAAGLAPGLPSGSGTAKYLREDGTWQKPPDTNTTYSTISRGSGAGLAPGLPSGSGTAKYLREDGTWQKPPDTDTTYSTISRGSGAGLAPGLPSGSGTTKYLREDGSWQVPPNTNTTYSAASGGGLSLSGTAFSIANSGVTAGNYGPSADAAPGYGGTFNVPYVTVDAKGRVTAASTKTITIPASDNTNTWRGIQNNLTSTSTTDSLAAAQGKALNDRLSSLESYSEVSKTFTGITTSIKKYGKLVMVTFENGNLSSAVAANGTIGTIPAGYLPKSYVHWVVAYNNVFSRVGIASGTGAITAAAAMESGKPLRGTICYMLA